MDNMRLKAFGMDHHPQEVSRAMLTTFPKKLAKMMGNVTSKQRNRPGVPSRNNRTGFKVAGKTDKKKEE